MIVSPMEKKKGYETVENVQMISVLYREKEVEKTFF